MKTLIFSLLLCLSAAAHAETLGQDRGGGDDIGLEVSATLRTAITNFKNMPVSRGMDFSAIEKKLETLKIAIVDDALPISIQDKIQDGVAANSPSENMIAVNRARWKAIANSHAKEGIMIHEALSLGGKESTGYYPYSGEYLRAFALSPLALVTGNTEDEKVPAIPAVSYRKGTLESIRTYVDTRTGKEETLSEQNMEPYTVASFYDEYLGKGFSLELLKRLPDRQDPSELTISIITNQPWNNGARTSEGFSKVFRSLGGAFETQTNNTRQMISSLPGTGFLIHAMSSDLPNNVSNYDSYAFEHYYADGANFESVLMPSTKVDAGGWRKDPLPPGEFFLTAMQANRASNPISESDFVADLTKGQRQALDDFKDLFTRALQLGKNWKDCVTGGQNGCDALKATYDASDIQRQDAFLAWIKVSELKVPRKKFIPKPKRAVPSKSKSRGGSQIVSGGFTPRGRVYNPGKPPTIGSGCYFDNHGGEYCPFPLDH